MSVLLGLAFLSLAAIAVAVMVASLKRYAPGIADLRSGLKEPVEAEGPRLTVHRLSLPEPPPLPDPQRPRHEPRPIRRMLDARKPSPAVS